MPSLSRAEIERRADEVLRLRGLQSIPLDPVVLANRLGVSDINAKFSGDSLVGMIANQGDAVTVLSPRGPPMARERTTGTTGFEPWAGGRRPAPVGGRGGPPTGRASGPSPGCARRGRCRPAGSTPGSPVRYGESDELAFGVAENKVHPHDLQATILHQLGMDRTKLTYRFQGRDYRLTDVHGTVIKDVLG